MNDDSITIGITAYNAMDSIAAAIESALAQDVPVAQIVVVDDLSSDQTVRIIEGYRIHHPKIELVRHDINAGVAAARNTIIAHASGTFLAFFDDDDISDPQRVRTQRAQILSYERDFAGGDPVICHTARKQIYPDGTERVEVAMGSAQGVAPHGREVLHFTLMGEPLRPGGFGSCATCSQMARVQTYRALGGFDVAFRRCEDSDLALRHANTGGHLTGLAEPLVTQVMTGTSDKNIDLLAHYFLMLLEKHQYAYESSASYSFSRRWTALKFDWLAMRRVRFLTGLAFLGARHPIQTARRIRFALPNMSGNRKFRHFMRSAPK